MTVEISRVESERMHALLARIEENQRQQNQKLTVILELLRRVQPADGQ